MIDDIGSSQAGDYCTGDTEGDADGVYLCQVRKTDSSSDDEYYTQLTPTRHDDCDEVLNRNKEQTESDDTQAREGERAGNVMNYF